MHMDGIHPVKKERNSDFSYVVLDAEAALLGLARELGYLLHATVIVRRGSTYDEAFSI